MVATAGNRKRGLDDDDERKPTRRSESEREREYVLKLLVPDYSVGALIGKGGAGLAEIKKNFGGVLKISRNQEYYPGTEERVVLITGDVMEVEDICNYIMEKIEDPGRDSTMREVEIDPTRAKKVKIVLTENASGRVIGRGGETIKAIAENSKANLVVQSPDRVTYPGERILTISGSFEERESACRQIIEELSSDATNVLNTTLKYPTSFLNFGIGRAPTSNGRQSNPATKRTTFRTRVTVEIEIPENLVGQILGKQGAYVKDMVQRSGGARFKFEDEKRDGVDERLLTITGSMSQVERAHNLLNERLDDIEQQSSRFIS